MGLDERELAALKHIRRLPVDYHRARLIVEEVSVREILQGGGRTEVVVSLRVRVDEMVEDVEAAVRRALAVPPVAPRGPAV